MTPYHPQSALKGRQIRAPLMMSYPTKKKKKKCGTRTKNQI